MKSYISKFFFSFALILVFITSISVAQIISTDRPDQTEGTHVLLKNKFQIESGYLITDSDNYLNTLLRYGVLNKIELRINSNMITGLVNNEKRTAFGNLELGLKFNIFNGINSSTKVSFLSHLSLPNKREFSNKDPISLNRILISHDLTESFQIGYNLGYNIGFNNQINNFIYTMVFSKSIQKLGIFIEVFGEESSGVSKSYWDAGVIYSLTDNLQADLSFSRGINNKSNYINIGISINI
ncbi:MAG: transporter [Cytophagales bacterium]|tara:strand:- start:643 stop:1362 length:720 start_codon:yes stop_codon:yes gene_type:complete